ncbi:MAG: response regulator [Azonexus sp.]|nr:response regulator [Azonexus sp.]
MSSQRVLVVDDEALNLMLIENFLEDEDLILETYGDPLEAWQRLQSADSDFSLVILDRMMPGMDGLELLRRIKQSSRFIHVPVIMQTAASAPEQVREGLEAGAYYYLTKPYEPEALISIVRAALSDQAARSQLSSQATRLAHSQRHLLLAEYAFSTLDDVTALVPLLAALCPEPDRVAPGLSDLMVNAIEHGNLGISYREKALLKWEGDWEGEIARRLALPQFVGRTAKIRFELEAQEIRFTISDEGEGFDWRKFLDFDPERAFDPNGRGIAMARLTSFCSLEYQGRGNVVVAKVSRTPLQPPAV